jgi:uncharacterized protein (UPF0332 family)
MPRGFNPRKFLDLGKTLLEDPGYESDSRARTALGRFYYAAFLIALQKLQQQGIAIQDDSKIHQEVIGTYMDKGLSSIGNILNQLREKRVDADYHMMAEVTLGNCRRYALFSERAIALVEQVREIR